VGRHVGDIIAWEGRPHAEGMRQARVKPVKIGHGGILFAELDKSGWSRAVRAASSILHLFDSVDHG
jgi:hypothetical protein